MRDLERLGADVLAGVLPRIYPQMLTLAHEHQDAGRRAYIVTAASQELATMLAQVLALDGAIGSQFSEVKDGVYTGRPAGLFIYRSDKARAIEELAAPRGDRPRRLLRVLRTPSPTCRCSRPSGIRSRSTPTRSSRGVARARGLGDPALRPARAQAEGGGRAGRRGRRRRVAVRHCRARGRRRTSRACSGR